MLQGTETHSPWNCYSLGHCQLVSQILRQGHCKEMRVILILSHQPCLCLDSPAHSRGSSIAQLKALNSLRGQRKEV